MLNFIRRLFRKKRPPSAPLTELELFISNEVLRIAERQLTSYELTTNVTGKPVTYIATRPKREIIEDAENY